MVKYNNPIACLTKMFQRCPPKKGGIIMRKFLIPILIIAIVCSAACGDTAGSTQVSAETQVSESCELPVNDEAEAALSDWIIGTDYGIVSGSIDTSQKTVFLALSEDRYQSLTEQDKQDIRSAVADILSLCVSPAAAEEYCIQYRTESGADMPGQTDGQTPPDTDRPEPDTSYSGEGPAAANLIFIHHSCGENWLNDGLCNTLNENGYHVADITYDWREYGNNTDTEHWPIWFTDEVMDLVYKEMDAMTAPNDIQPAAGENEIIMFKSCFPNSDVGPEITDEKDIYNSLLPYFERHPGKMFVLVTPPPMIQISYPAKTRELCDWLADREAGWLAGLSTGNVFVFDFYNVLTHPDAHHQLLNGEEVHSSVPGADTLYYPSGDDHPNTDGNIKAAQEFIGLLNYWYGSFSGSRGFKK
jgi:hypothetical protein